MGVCSGRNRISELEKKLKNNFSEIEYYTEKIDKYLESQNYEQADVETSKREQLKEQRAKLAEQLMIINDSKGKRELAQIEDIALANLMKEQEELLKIELKNKNQIIDLKMKQFQLEKLNRMRESYRSSYQVKTESTRTYRSKYYSQQQSARTNNS